MFLIRQSQRLVLFFIMILLSAWRIEAQTADIQSVINSLSPAQAAEAKAMAGSMSPQDALRALKQTGEPSSAASKAPVNDKIQTKKTQSGESAAKAVVDDVPLSGFATRTAIRPFGAQLMAGGDSMVRTLDIPVPGDYQIGPGDTFELQLFGKENRGHSLKVNRDGLVNLPDIGPLPVSGMTFESASKAILERISRQKIGVEASITLGPLRSIQVFLVGDVRNPGAYTVPALATVTNALLEAGGVLRNGSLRRVELRRGGRVASRLDLYEVLLNGNVRADVRLQPSDVIFVPPAGMRVGIEGEVNRPALYELLTEKTANDLIHLAGGLLPTAFADGAKLYRALPDDSRKVEDLLLSGSKDKAIRLQNGDVLNIPVSVDALRGSIELIGAVQRPGPYEWRPGIKLVDLLPSMHLINKDAWRLLLLIQRSNPLTGLDSYLASDLISVLRKTNDFELKQGDRIFVLDRADIDFISSPMIQSALHGKTTAGGCEAVNNLAAIIKIEGNERYRTAVVTEGALAEPMNCSPLFARNPELLPVALEHTVIVRGEVKRPGFILIASGLGLMDLIDASGGFTRAANEDQVEISMTRERDSSTMTERMLLRLADLAKARIEPGAIVHVRKRFNEMDRGAVRVAGEVIAPGLFEIRRGERLSEVLLRAGGLTRHAYPYGAVFQRVSVKEEKRLYYQRAGIEMQNSIIMMTARQKRTAAGGPDANTFVAMRDLAEELKKVDSSGRVVVEADPAVLQVHPELDVVLEPGDEIVIPKRPSHVVVMGEVLNPGAVQFQSGLRAEDYLRAAGGISVTGDETRTYVILPNGNAQPLKVASWNAQPTPVPPGSVIYVPRDPLPLDNTALFQTVIEMAKDIALAGAALYGVTK